MNEFYTVFHNALDLSLQVRDFTTPSAELDLLATDYLYVGYRKPFNTMYCEVKNNVIENNFTAEAYVDGVWTPLTVLDETKGFTKSGFITFVKPDKWQVVDVNSKKLFYIRLKPSLDHTAGSLLTGLGVLLANDLDLIEIRSNIVSKHNSGNSWVTKHQAARKYIIQEIRNKGNRKIKTVEGENSPFTDCVLKYSDISEFDLLEPFQLRMAAAYKTLSMIYLDELHDEENDKWFRQGSRYEEEFYKMMNLFFLKLDLDDDGKESPSESRNDTGVNLTWV